MARKTKKVTKTGKAVFNSGQMKGIRKSVSKSRKCGAPRAVIVVCK